MKSPTHFSAPRRKVPQRMARHYLHDTTVPDAALHTPLKFTIHNSPSVPELVNGLTLLLTRQLPVGLLESLERCFDHLIVFVENGVVALVAVELARHKSPESLPDLGVVLL